MSSTSRCKYPLCQREIRWVTLTASGKGHPIDPVPEADGNIAITGRGERGRVMAATLSRAACELHDGPLYRSHFATCPGAAEFRR